MDHLTGLPDNYRGREQSYIKHLFLTQYLEAAAYKILQGRSPILNFVDAFAGPWRVSDANYSDASFDQALTTLEAVRAYLGKAGLSGLRIRFCFCERQSDRVIRLREYAGQHRQFDIRIFHGSFEDHLGEIADSCRDGFTFTFIDPTGWNIRSEPILEFLRDRRGEFLLNFMSEHVNRHAEYPKVAESIGRFLADPNWADDFKKLPLDWTNEQRVLHLFKQKVKATGAATYLPDFPILKPREDRVKMRLLLGTHSKKGLEVFRDVQSKVERKEIETRNQIADESKNRFSLFTGEEIAEMQQGSAGIGSPRYKREATDQIVAMLTRTTPLPFDALLTNILENIPMRGTQAKELLKEMKSNGLVTFELPPGRKVVQPDTMISLP